MLQNPRRWNLIVLTRLFNQEDVKGIMSIPLGSIDEEDSLIWHFSGDGKCTVKAGYKVAYRYLLEGSNPRLAPQAPWKKIWKLRIPLKIRNFIWRVCWQAIGVNSALFQMKLNISPECQRCGETEDAQHLLLYCPYARAVWIHSLLALRSDQINSNHISEWITTWFDSRSYLEGDFADWAALQSIICWQEMITVSKEYIEA
uniref:Reverse transcriptase zinc-binding domain-containing protein n=1 Tax=Nelumbo nucifera TaxID=4432 RepID=A0A822YTG2_NELNU|nr:TPA_asm: hypothetical protein HUJ06_006430 [Nelumbo nucifera]